MSKENIGGGNTPAFSPLKAFNKIDQDLDKWFLGFKEENTVLLAALAARLPILLEGPHGTAKSTIAKRLAHYFGETAFYRQVKSQMTIYDIFYEYDIAELMKGKRVIIPKALGANFVILDEALAHPILLSAIHDFIEDHSVDGIPAKWKFCIFATNPKNEFYESSTLALANFATSDRFAVINYLNPPKTYDLFELGLRTEKQFKPPDPDFKFPIEVLDEAYAEVEKVTIPLDVHLRLQLLLSALSECTYTPASSKDTAKDNVNKWMLMGSSVEALCGTCRHKNEICGKSTCSPTRAQRAVIWLSKALAWLRGNSKVSQDDFETALRHVMPHRIFYVPSFMRDHPTAQDAFQALYGMYLEDMKRRTDQGAFQLLANIYRKIGSGAWDKDSYDSLIMKFGGDLPLRKFAEGLKAKRYPEIRGALYQAAEAEQDPASLALMKSQISGKGLDNDDEVQLTKYVDEKVVGKTIQIQIVYTEADRSKTIGKLTLALAPHVSDVKALNNVLRVTGAFSNQDFPGLLIQHVDGAFTVTVIEVDVAKQIRSKLGLEEKP